MPLPVITSPHTNTVVVELLTRFLLQSRCRVRQAIWRFACCGPGHRPLPVFAEIDKRLDEVKRRAFEFFDRRGREWGHELEDWIRAERQVMGWPAAELEERDGEYKLEVTLPGYAPGQIEITATPAEIVVHADTKAAAAKKEEKKPDEARTLWTEFGPNNVYRRFRLPQPIDVDKTNAVLEQGLLKITAVKAVQAKAKPIPVAGA